MAKEILKLTDMTSAGGWAAKIGPEELASVLSKLPKNTSDKMKNLIVGLDTADDAAIYKLTDDIALIQTLDFFTPMVDDPYMFGQIAAANALSDVYAMGGEPTVAMNIVCFPSCHDMEVLGEILRGGADKVNESGCLLVGGHTVDDKEPKYGLSVSGVVHPDKVLANSTSRVGDKLILTKPLGAGIMNTAMKPGLVDNKTADYVTTVMSHLNKYAAMSFKKFPVNAATDITGFGMLGHTLEVAKASNVTIRLDSKAIPIMDQALDFARMGIIPEGAYKNMGYVQDDVIISENIEEALSDILHDPQTSGGLLVSLPAEYAEDMCKDMLENGSICAEIVGEVVEKEDKFVIVY